MRVHLLATAEPVQAGSEVKALCQTVVSKAAFLFAIEGELQSEDVSMLGNCRKCGKVWAGQGRYVYGVAEEAEVGIEAFDSIW